MGNTLPSVSVGGGRERKVIAPEQKLGCNFIMKSLSGVSVL